LRLRRLLVKLCAQEKELTLMLLIDTSRSMRFGKPDKLWMAARFAAVLAGIALNDGNRAGIATVGKSLRELVKPERNRVSLTAILNALSRLETVDSFDPARCLREFAARYGRKCMVVLISDLLYPEWSQTIRNLASSGCEGYILQLLAPEELEPPYLDEVTLVDQENATEVGVYMDRETARGYRTELARYLLEVRQTCHRLGLGHTMAATDDLLGRVFHEELRKGGLLC
ncbi:MAG TPA: VWA domain-containing protein, partial [Bacillota bacterium]|nr:VWA domain-containing protein [Bacillota bacterium]